MPPLPVYVLIQFCFVCFILQGICNTSDNPTLFLKYFKYLDSVEDHEAPDYEWLTELFASQLTDEELAIHDLGVFDLDSAPDKIQLEAQLMGKIIDGRFEIKNYLRSEFAVFVLNGLMEYPKSRIFFILII